GRALEEVERAVLAAAPCVTLSVEIDDVRRRPEVEVALVRIGGARLKAPLELTAARVERQERFVVGRSRVGVAISRSEVNGRRARADRRRPPNTSAPAVSCALCRLTIRIQVRIHLERPAEVAALRVERDDPPAVATDSIRRMSEDDAPVED